jgi:response regulator RpfG family c-di-GMP phosphodiesterase
MMPVMDGYEMLKELRDNNEDVPVLFLTAKSAFDDKKKGFDLGIDDYITKPIDYEELFLRIKALLRRANIANKLKSINYDKAVYINLPIIATCNEVLILDNMLKKLSELYGNVGVVANNLYGLKYVNIYPTSKSYY